MADLSDMFGNGRRTWRSTVRGILRAGYECRLYIALRTRAGKAAEQDFIAITEIIEQWDKKDPKQIGLSRNVTVRLQHHQDNPELQPLAFITGAGTLLRQMLIRHYDGTRRGGFSFLNQADGQNMVIVRLTY